MERDACGIGFVARPSGRPSREVLDMLLEALRRVRHRGAVAADARSGDGAGVLLPLPAALLPEPGCGLAMVFLRGPDGRRAVEDACAAEGIAIRAWREVPVDPEALGPEARASAPEILQAVLEPPPGDPELAAFRARKAVDGRADVYVASLSFRTVVYKALCAADQLDAFYADLRDPRLEVSFGVFHQRFATNTRPSWERAQPFRLLCHNGEINAIRGNANWMRARAGTIGDRVPGPLVDESSSDSGMLDNALELLVRNGREVGHGLAMLVPPAWHSDRELDPDVRAFYRYHAGLVEPWDGPAGVVFTDGRAVGAALDRHGLRPLRYAVAEDLVCCASEAGVFDLEGSVRRGRLGAGEMLVVDPELGLQEDAEVKRRLAARRPYAAWLEEWRREGHPGSPAEPPAEELAPRHVLFGYTREEIATVIRPSASSGHEPTSSMGDDTALAPLAGRARPLYGYFRQRFAQVTNPPIDHIRERFAMSLGTLLGGRAPLLDESPEAAAGVELDSFFLFPGALDGLAVVRLDATFEADEALEAACERLGAAAEDAVRDGHGMLLLSDADASPERPPVPMLLATSSVHHRLVGAGLRTLATLVVESDEPREVHHFACLLGFGAEAVHPRLALETVAALAKADRLGGDRPSPAGAQHRYRRSIEDGVLKVMSKMGISDVASYCGAQVFEAIGLEAVLVERAFPGTPASAGAVGLAALEAETLARAAAAAEARPRLENPGYVKFRKGGEPHETNPDVVEALQAAVRSDDMEAAHALRRAVAANGDGWARYETFAGLVNGRAPMEVRDLLDLDAASEPVPLDEVEPAEEIVRRFSAGGMSHGALSAEAHETIAVAFNNLGARSNCGEGGEDPARFRTERNSRIKQIASGRFGVTAEYAAFAAELQIKIAQGSKPGEGGQLPGHKVTDEIARLRHTQPGVALISPPPHHDIYSIEDLAQLIFDLRQVNPEADVSVKLVAEAGVGVVAAGVAKALADVIHIAGSDGGTGASPLGSIKNAGAPWELGLVETQHALVENGLRGRVRLRVDGGIKTGRDVVAAALLGADEVSFGTALLLAEGCLMVRSCHVDTCPVGIATQRPELRAKFAATPEMVESYLLFVAEEARRHLAALGLRSLDEAVGRVDLLRRRRGLGQRADALDVDALLVRPRGDALRHVGAPVPRATGGELGERVAADEEGSYRIRNADRAVGARLAGKRAVEGGGAPRTVRFHGSAGQSFGAFLPAGVEFVLEGEANDYVGKSLSGGRIVVRPPAGDAGRPCLVGNTVLYGATGGELHVAGAAGERFAVRNSGATAVVEGVGSNACEYMTNGTVVVLGPFGRNLAAGMTGGEAFVHDPQHVLPIRLNDQLVRAEPLDAPSAARVEALLRRHLELTGSELAAALLAAWPAAAADFRAVRPKPDVGRLEAEAEGTEGTGDEPAADREQDRAPVGERD